MIWKNIFKRQQVNIKSQHRFRSEKHYVLNEELKKVALSANDNKIIQSINRFYKNLYIPKKQRFNT